MTDTVTLETKVGGADARQLGRVLAELIKQAAPRNDTRSVLRCIHVKVQADTWQFTAADGYRVARVIYEGIECTERISDAGSIEPTDGLVAAAELRPVAAALRKARMKDEVAVRFTTGAISERIRWADLRVRVPSAKGDIEATSRTDPLDLGSVYRGWPDTDRLIDEAGGGTTEPLVPFNGAFLRDAGALAAAIGAPAFITRLDPKGPCRIDVEALHGRLSAVCLIMPVYGRLPPRSTAAAAKAAP